MLCGMIGDRSINIILINEALDNTPALLIDCANVADIHKFKGRDIEQYANLYVLEVDSLYRLIPTLRQLSKILKKIGVKKVFMTSFTHLFNYDNDLENKDVYIYAWELLSNYATEFNIYVAVEKGTIHEHLSKVHGMKTMGHTNTSQRMMIDKLLGELQSFGNALDEQDRLILNDLLKKPLKHFGSITYASPLNPEIFILLSIILEQQKRIIEHEKMFSGRLQREQQSNTLAKSEQ